MCLVDDDCDDFYEVEFYVVLRDLMVDLLIVEFLWWYFVGDCYVVMC